MTKQKTPKEKTKSERVLETLESIAYDSANPAAVRVQALKEIRLILEKQEEKSPPGRGVADMNLAEIRAELERTSSK